MSRSMALPVEKAPVSPKKRPRIGPVLVALDEATPQNLVRAVCLLAPDETPVILAVRVLEPRPMYAAGMEAMILPPHFEEERRLAAARRLDAEVREVVGNDPAWHTTVVFGEPSDAIDELARQSHAAMIVMGLGKHPPIDRLLGAETTLRTIRRAPCAVLAMHPSFEGPFRNVVVATDFSAGSVRAAEIVLPLLGADATLHLVHVWDRASTELASLAAVDAEYAASLPDRFRRVTGALAVPHGVSVTTATREGKTPERLIDYARTHHADLIVAGRHGLNVLKRMLVGSVTSALVRGAECSVLVSPEPSFAVVDRLHRLLTGSSESTRSSEWGVQLVAFSDRNRGRRTVVEVDDRAFDAHVVESGYVLLGASYDHDQSRVELALGDADHMTRQVIRGVGMVDSVTVATAPDGTDLGLRISHGGGETVLTFVRD